MAGLQVLSRCRGEGLAHSRWRLVGSRSFECGTTQRHNKTSAKRSRLRSRSARRRTYWGFASFFFKQALNLKASIKTAATTDRFQTSCHR